MGARDLRLLPGCSGLVGLILEVDWLGRGPRLTQQCLGAGWESLILPGNDGGPCPCVSVVHCFRPQAPVW